MCIVNSLWIVHSLDIPRTAVIVLPIPSPLTITLLAKKGGVGKSTVCLLLHEAFKKAGKTVAIQDWDAQGTSNKALAFVNGQRAEPDASYEILLIDTPPNLEHPATRQRPFVLPDIAIVVTSPAPGRPYGKPKKPFSS